MGVFRSIVRGTAKSFLDVPSWLGLRQLKDQTHFFVDHIKPLFSIPKVEKSSLTFDEVVRTHNLSEADLLAQQKRCFAYSILYLVVGIGCLFYCGYLLLEKSLISGILAFLIAALFFLFSFAMHFFFFQIKHKKLGCSFREWWSSQIGEN